MTSVQQSQEDLEARIARIKKRNEEIEKKHREAEADRLMAMKENAMVEIKPPKDEDWPREHKYDKIDFTYDLDADALAELEEKKKEKNAFIQKIAKDYKVFAEGEGPPPDPAYSFLADVERDGEKAQSALAAASSAMTPGMPGSVPNRGGKNQFDRKTPMNRSGRLGNNGVGLNGSGGSGRGRGKPGGGGYSGGGGLQRSLSTNEHDGGRRGGPAPPPNGDYIRHNRGGGGGQGEGGKWRRDWEHDRSKDDGCINSQSSNGLLRGGDPQQQQQQQQGLTVSVSQDGEFKSVKVTAPPVWGSGRVGPRQPAKPQFQFQTGPGGYNQQQQHPHHQQPPHHHRGGAGPNNENHFNRNTSGRKSDKDVNGGKQQRGGPQQQQGPAGSVQDRLNRNRVGTSNGGGSSEQLKSNPSLKTISKIIEKNAEIDERLARQMFQENEKMASRMKELRMQDGA
ncbi:protein FAM98A-like [Culex pipiens pallens]|uniref:protein FAM98A-like n=1 Tax=Culex pipiens pallens TaxID=42434 RepID=UPI0019540A85|nr:protein FAM98A-like [Culex pipiens pallens]